MEKFLPAKLTTYDLKKHYLPTRLFKLCIFMLCLVTNFNVSAQVVNWIGGTSSDYYTKNNWSDNTIDFANFTGVTLMIGPGNPNNCVHVGGNSSNVNYRPAKLNVLSTGAFTMSGAIYPNKSDSINGTVTLNSPADLNIRDYAYIGRNNKATITINGGKLSSKYTLNIATGTSGSNATINLSGGAIYAGTDVNIANGTGLTAQVNITGGALYVPGNLNIGSAGKIYISGIGLISLTGNKVAAINTLISAGKITCTPGKTLSVVYDNTNTVVSIPQPENSMLREYPEYVILKNSVLEARISKSTSNITSLKVNGVETLNTVGTSRTGTYYDFTTSAGFETIYGATFSVKRDEQDLVDISFKRPYIPGSNATPCDADIHYVLKKDDSGIYTYSILEHQATYPAFDLGSWRQVLWIAPDPNNSNNYLCERIYADSLRNWQMPSLYDFSQASPSGIAEIVKLNTGVRAGKYDGKYEYSMPFWENPVWGHASDVNKIGTWFVNGSLEYFNEGPTYHDLNSAAGIIHSCMNGVHYNAIGMDVPNGEYWTKIYGPYLIYTSLKNTGKENWDDAKARGVAEKGQWPYSWLTSTPQYPLASGRGSVTGKFVINDSFKPGVKGQKAWVGVVIISNPEGEWQFEEKNYQYWVKTDADGNFTIPNVRPGTNYTFFGYSDGAVGDFSMANVSVTAGAATDLGTVTWNIPRNKGNLVWEIGYPNRKANEFKMGDFDYCEGFAHNKFASVFANPIEYDVAGKDWANKLPYAHSVYVNTDQTLSTWKWRLNFTLPSDIPTTGNATLTIAYAGNDHAQQWIYVNNENSTFNTYYPENGGGNGLLRQTNYAKYSTKTITIPMSRLRPGANTITLLNPSGSSTVNHLMYDYISLEADVNVAMPVSLKSFDAKADGQKVKLNWEVTSEKDNDRFEIERSADGETFATIAIIKGQGTIAHSHKYETNDNKPFNGNNYYRLIQYDFNGTRTEKGIKVVTYESLSEQQIEVFPNPNEGAFKIKLPIYSASEMMVSIVDISGREIYRTAITVGVNNNTIPIDMGFKPSAGEYILKVKGANLNLNKKIIFK